MKQLAPALLALVLIVGCTDDDDGDETVTAGSEPTTTTAPASTEPTTGATTTTLIEGGEALEPIDLSELASDPGWAPSPDDPAAIEEFNAYVADGPKPYATSALDLAAVFLGLEEVEGGRVEAAVEDVDGGTLVTVLEAGVGDDSIAALLSQLRFEPGGATLTLTEVTRQQSCQPGRGHEDFSTDPCT